jgi:hypothetical protein
MVPTASLLLLYGFFVIEHGRRHTVYFNAATARARRPRFRRLSPARVGLQSRRRINNDE